ncbi:MAG: NAD(P)/FAD-dependent oxidoreductase, partial [Peptostreptococcaceae bacterium]|nr:NAD(P)/FAD-dependent oxidoreductase [Peptostreptococcaceae bacterium]
MAKVIVVGGGPAGIMAAISASKQNEVILIEKNNEIGKKLKLTGGGRCNITNNRNIEDFFDKVVNNKKFLYSSFYTFSNYDLLEYFKENNLEYKVEYDEKVYTKSDKADDVINVLLSNLSKNNVEIISISDHNSVKAVERALNYSRDKDIKVIPGIEIDCTFNDINLHLL